MGDVVRDLLYPQGVKRWGLSRVAGLSLLGSRQTGCENQKKRKGFRWFFFSCGFCLRVQKNPTLSLCSKSAFVDGFGVSMGLLKGRGWS